MSEVVCLRIEMPTEQYLGLLDWLKDNTSVFQNNERLFDAFAKVDRGDFVRPESYAEAYENIPLYIGSEQTTSQPYTVAFMLKLLDVKPDNRVLEVGYGGGWQTCILSELAEDGEVHATEVIPEIKKFGESNISEYNPKNVSLYQAKEGEVGLPDVGPFDRIIVCAESENIPQSLLDQLARDGILVAPESGSVVKIKKDNKGKISREEYKGFAFVPLKE